MNTKIFEVDGIYTLTQVCVTREREVNLGVTSSNEDTTEKAITFTLPNNEDITCKETRYQTQKDFY